MQHLSMESIKSDLQALEKKIERLDASLQNAKRDRDAMLLVVNRYSEKPKRRSSRKNDLGVDPDEIRGMSLESALIHIAEQNDGELVSTNARELLEKAEILSGEKTARILWLYLKSSGQFKKNGGRGIYKLIPEEETV